MYPVLLVPPWYFFTFTQKHDSSGVLIFQFLMFSIEMCSTLPFFCVNRLCLLECARHFQTVKLKKFCSKTHLAKDSFEIISKRLLLRKDGTIFSNCLTTSQQCFKRSFGYGSLYQSGHTPRLKRNVYSFRFTDSWIHSCSCLGNTKSQDNIGEAGRSKDPKEKQRAENWENLLDNDDKRENISSIPVKRENIFTVPNALSLSRIIATPYLAYLVSTDQYSLALAIFFVAGITDILDGQIARKWPSQKSAFGTALDPLGDKILVTTLTISLTMSGIIPLLLTILIVGRDVLLMASVFYLRYRTCPRPLTLKRYFDPTLVNAQLNPTLVSKVNTVLQMAVIWLSLCAPVFQFTGHPALNGLYFVTAVTTVWSGASYVFNKDTVQILKDE